MKILLVLPLLLGLMSPAIAHNDANDGDAMHVDNQQTPIGHEKCGSPIPGRGALCPTE